MRRTRIILSLLAAPALAAAQARSESGSPPVTAASSPAASVMTASRASQAVVIDGRDDDAVWKNAMVIDGFRTFTPIKDGEPRFRTEARVAYDEKNLYIFTRMYDPHPDSITSLM